jgi:hypothetical protein
MQNDIDAVQMHLRPAIGITHREINVEVVERSEESRYPHQAAGYIRQSDGQFTERNQVAECRSIRNDEVGDERLMECNRVRGKCWKTDPRFGRSPEIAQSLSAMRHGRNGSPP